MTSIQHIILSCTNRKRRDASPKNRLRDVPATDVEARAAAWIQKISGAPAFGRAEDLYGGEYWQAGLALAKTAASRWPTEVSVVSAGLGLVRADSPVPNYAATFTYRHPDSVVVGDRLDATALRRQWWDALADWSGPGASGPRRLPELARSPGARLLVCVGPDYLDAIAEDLRAAHKVVGDDRLVIIGSGPAPAGLSEVWVHCPGQLRMQLGGSMASAGVRAARVILADFGSAGAVDVGHAREVIDALLRDAAPLPRFDRARLSDDKIVAWIGHDARSNPGRKNKSAALRRLRDGGQACEQGRFAHLYDETMRGTQ